MAKYCFYAAVVYLFFVVYGSLVPLDYQPIPWSQAEERFKHIRYLDLGMESRADWIANIVLYIPLAFLWAMLLTTVRQPILRGVGMGFVLIGCLLLAIAIEFCQLFFPPRTVSLNDLIAETLGTVIGLLTAIFGSKQVIKLLDNLNLGGLLSIKALITLYLLAYVVLSFFPFDIVTSFAELEIKLAQGNDHIFMSLTHCQKEGLRCAVKFIVEIVVLLPAGGLVYLLPHVAYKRAVAILMGFFLGFFTELGQLFLISGTAQGLSILTRMLGMMLGVMVADGLSKQNLAYWRPWLRPMVLISTPFYLLAVFCINGGLSETWLNSDSITTKLTETHFMPFYYFYYTTETIALVSLISNIGTYLPIGLAYWLWQRASVNRTVISWVVVGLTGAVLASFVETEKLFLATKHADPTDIGIAFVTAAGSYVWLDKIMYWITGHHQ